MNLRLGLNSKYLSTGKRDRCSCNQSDTYLRAARARMEKGSSEPTNTTTLFELKDSLTNFSAGDSAGVLLVCPLCSLIIKEFL